MRVLLKLSAEKEQNGVMESHKLQGFVYRVLKDAGYTGLHSKAGYKFFCFSNLFPIGDMKAGDIRNLVISSPNEDIIKATEKAARSYGMVNIGELSFTIKDVSVIQTKIDPRRAKVVSSTPIVIRIPEENYDRYGIPQDERKKRYVYWRPKYSFEAFLKQLSANLIKKYNDFYGTKIEDYNLFEQFLFKRTVATKLVIDGKGYDVIGSLWEFMWTHMDNMQKNIIEFGLDTGFGERNSMGFGFVNAVRSKNF